MNFWDSIATFTFIILFCNAFIAGYYMNKLIEAYIEYRLGELVG